MPVEVILPKVDMDMASGTIAEWHKAEGETVTAGEPLFDIETDKSSMEVESPGNGTLHFVSAHVGDEVPIGQVIAWLFAEGEAVEAPAGCAAPQRAAKPAQVVEVAPPPVSALNGREGLRATPLARRVAREKSIELADVTGTGPRGRITRADVEGFTPTAETASPPAQRPAAKTGAQATADALGIDYDLIPVSKMRAVIAARLTESKSTVPHFYLDADIQLDALLALRAQINEAGAKNDEPKISINDLLVKASAIALKAVPRANASWDGENIVQYQGAHISVAVALDDGLVTPVLRDVQAKGLHAVSAEVADLVQRAKSGKLSAAEMKGGSFSISNLGMFGVKSFNAIINPPESLILAVGQAQQQFLPDDEGNPKLVTVMSVTLSCDHRIVDGALGAQWLQEFKALIENPLKIVLT